MAVVGHPCTALCLFLLLPPSPHYKSLNHRLREVAACLVPFSGLTSSVSFSQE